MFAFFSPTTPLKNKKSNKADCTDIYEVIKAYFVVLIWLENVANVVFTGDFVGVSSYGSQKQIYSVHNKNYLLVKFFYSNSGFTYKEITLNRQYLLQNF